MMQAALPQHLAVSLGLTVCCSESIERLRLFLTRWINH